MRVTPLPGVRSPRTRLHTDPLVVPAGDRAFLVVFVESDQFGELVITDTLNIGTWTKRGEWQVGSHGFIAVYTGEAQSELSGVISAEIDSAAPCIIEPFSVDKYTPDDPNAGEFGSSPVSLEIGEPVNGVLPVIIKDEGVPWSFALSIARPSRV